MKTPVSIPREQATEVAVRCAWQDVDAAIAARFADATAFHAAHGARDLSVCDAWICRCGNRPDLDGFHQCDDRGREIDPEPDDHIFGALYLCGGCGRILTEAGLQVRGPLEATESADLLAPPGRPSA
jgi:hypothetical protein